MRTAQGPENLDVFVPRCGGFGLRHSHRSKQETESRAQVRKGCANRAELGYCPHLVIIYWGSSKSIYIYIYTYTL